MIPPADAKPGLDLQALSEFSFAHPSGRGSHFITFNVLPPIGDHMIRSQAVLRDVK